MVTLWLLLACAGKDGPATSQDSGTIGGTDSGTVTTDTGHPADSADTADSEDTADSGDSGDSAAPATPEPLSGTHSLADAPAKIFADGSDDRLGRLSPAGDQDGDGVADCWLAAERAHDASGVVYLLTGPLSGRVDTAELPDRIDGTDQVAYLGLSLDGATDLDGDGVADLIVGSGLWSESGAALDSQALLFFGPLTGLRDSADAAGVFLGERSEAYFGRWVAAAPDLLGSGGAIAVGAYGNDNLPEDPRGRVHLFAAAASSLLASDALAVLTPEGTQDEVSLALAGGHDLDGDGLADLLVGVPELDVVAYATGGVYVVPSPVSGSLSLGDAGHRLDGVQQDGAGTSVAAGGDLDGDGHADLLIGATGFYGYGTSPGRVYVVSGPITGDDTLDRATAVIEGTDDADHLGSAVVFAGDLDQDGHPDLAVGASELGEASTGGMQVLYGPVSGNLQLQATGATWLAVTAGERAGSSIAAPGDMDLDGLDDLLIGAWGYGQHDAGAAWLVPGASW